MGFLNYHQFNFLAENIQWASVETFSATEGLMLDSRAWRRVYWVQGRLSAQIIQLGYLFYFNWMDSIVLHNRMHTVHSFKHIDPNKIPMQLLKRKMESLWHFQMLWKWMQWTKNPVDCGQCTSEWSWVWRDAFVEPRTAFRMDDVIPDLQDLCDQLLGCWTCWQVHFLKVTCVYKLSAWSTHDTLKKECVKTRKAKNVIASTLFVLYVYSYCVCGANTVSTTSNDCPNFFCFW